MSEKRIDYVKKDIRSVLITAKNGLSLEEFRRAYKSLVGVRLPSREFGYTLDIDFLYSIPDVVRIKVESDGKYQLYVVADETTEHIQKLVSRQKTPKITNNRNNVKSSNFKPYNVHTSKNTNKGQPFVHASEGSMKGRPFVPAKLRGQIIELVKEYPDGIGYTCLAIAYQNRYKKPLNLVWLSNIPEEQFRKLCYVIPELQIKIFNNQEKIFYLNDENNCTKERGMKAITGSNSVSKHLKVFRKSLENSTSAAYHGNPKNLDFVIPEIVKCRFQQVLRKYPNGILAVHFPILYEKITGIPLDIHDLGFSSLLELAGALPDIFFYVEVPGSLKDWILLHRDYSKNGRVRQILANYENQRSAEIDSQHEIDVPSIPSSMLPTSSSISHLRGNNYSNLKPSEKKERDVSSLMPKLSSYMPKNSLCNIAPSSLTYIEAELPVDAMNTYLPVFISSITSPSQFWIQLETESGTSDFNKLEAEIISFYSNEQLDSYKLADADILVGSSCVAYSSADNHYYRAIIVALPDIDYATVSLIDYGSWQRVQRSALYYLQYKFITLPAYAHEAKLACIKPLNQNWSTQACKKFISFCNSISIKAKIDSVYHGTTAVFLCEITEKDSIYINDVLVEEGFAQLDLIGNSCNDSSFANLRIKKEVFATDVRHPQTAHSSTFQDKTMESELQIKNLFNGQNLPNSHLKKKRRYVKTIALGDGYYVNIVVVNDKAYISNGDVCNLFWTNRSPRDFDVTLVHQKGDGKTIQRTTILEKDFKELFFQCKRYSVKGVHETENGNALTLYSLKDVMKVLNIFGHPSSRVRENIYKEIETFDPHDKTWQDFNELDEEQLEKKTPETDSLRNRFCLYDFKVKRELLRIQRWKLARALEENKINNSTYIRELENLEVEQNIIMKEMDNLQSICSKCASLSL